MRDFLRRGFVQTLIFQKKTVQLVTEQRTDRGRAYFHLMLPQESRRAVDLGN
jgi:hypothetical protein